MQRHHLDILLQPTILPHLLHHLSPTCRCLLLDDNDPIRVLRMVSKQTNAAISPILREVISQLPVPEGRDAYRYNSDVPLTCCMFFPDGKKHFIFTKRIYDKMSPRHKAGARAIVRYTFMTTDYYGVATRIEATLNSIVADLKPEIIRHYRTCKAFTEGRMDLPTFISRIAHKEVTAITYHSGSITLTMAATMATNTVRSITFPSRGWWRSGHSKKRS